MPSTLKVGIVGCAGRGSSFFAPFHANPRTCVHALCDINPEGLAQVAADQGVDLTYSDCEEMLDGAGIDILMVGTPMPFHASQAIMALERGIHVLSEVPACVSVDEAKLLVGAARKSNAHYMMAENYCYIRTNVLIEQLIREGLFGEPYYGEGEYVHELKELNEVTKWRRKWQTGVNGNTYPTHSLGPLLQWFEQRVTAVSCAGAGHHYTDPRGDYYENEDSTTMLCRLERGGLAQIRLDMLSNRPHNLTYYAVQGTDGCYEAPRGFGDDHKIWLKSHCSDPNQWVSLSEFEGHLPDKWLNPPQEALESGHWGGDYMEVCDFIDAITADEAPPIGIDIAMDMTLPGLVSQVSIAEGSRWVEVPDPRKW
jgi:predicted dehydrogenase